ncbi:hypothetical protein [Polynucleobacter sp. TUM22923]|uniref:hypothetical protein n=1 Tax=Polynucleobacter sp. TUM22923 TaxID=3022126 RepID=UPI002572384E|nr:hypothetical protein [Polynucleobacter sp. TUM22923]
MTAELADFEILDFLNGLRTLNDEIQRSGTVRLPLSFHDGSNINAHHDVIRRCLSDLEAFSEENEIQQKDMADLDSLLGLSTKYYEYKTSIKDWMLFAYLKEQAEIETRENDVQEDDWHPPDNWEYGTDDEKEAHRSFWENKK